MWIKTPMWRMTVRIVWMLLVLAIPLLPTRMALAAAVGVNTHQPAPDVLDAAKDLGVGWIRIDLNWFQVEPSKGAYNWALIDGIVDGARRRGLQVFPTLGYAPSWASEPDRDGIATNNVPKAGEYGRFCQAVAARYAGKITHFGLWNEPNLSGFFEGTMGQWIDRVVLEGTRGIKAGCPSCKVLGPELATVGKEYANYLDAALRALASAGLMYDVVTWHIYANFVDLDPGLLFCSADTFQNKLDAHRVCKVGGLVVYEGPLSVREILLKNGLGSLPVWITETGRTASITDSKRLTDQATYYRRVLEEQLKRSWYQNTFFYEIVDDNAISDKWGMAVQSGTGYPAAFRKKPVWDLVKKALSTPLLGGSGSECSDGLDNDGDKRIDFPADPDCKSARDTKEAPPTLQAQGFPAGPLDAPGPPAPAAATGAVEVTKAALSRPEDGPQDADSPSLMQRTAPSDLQPAGCSFVPRPRLASPEAVNGLASIGLLSVLAWFAARRTRRTSTP